MIKQVSLVVAMVLCGAYPTLAQRPDEHPAPQAEPPHSAPPKANNGHIPPPPPKRENAPSARPQANENRPPDNRTPENRPQENRPADNHTPPQQNVRPHVENDKWLGHDTNDARYRIARPYEHGHFQRFGQQYRYSVQRIDRDHHEFWFPGGFYFQIADWDWPEAADWCWNCGDNFVVYEDPDHPGWYLVYNTETGEYVHAQYMGG